VCLCVCCATQAEKTAREVYTSRPKKPIPPLSTVKATSMTANKKQKTRESRQQTADNKNTGRRRVAGDRGEGAGKGGYLAATEAHTAALAAVTAASTSSLLNSGSGVYGGEGIMSRTRGGMGGGGANTGRLGRSKVGRGTGIVR
jgi:hypothetical protein